jgi:hypothetical protein
MVVVVVAVVVVVVNAAASSYSDDFGSNEVEGQPLPTESSKTKLMLLTLSDRQEVERLRSSLDSPLKKWGIDRR